MGGVDDETSDYSRIVSIRIASEPCKSAFGQRGDLALSIHCPEKDLKQGDEIPIVFTITNEGSPSEFGAH